MGSHTVLVLWIHRLVHTHSEVEGGLNMRFLCSPSFAVHFWHLGARRLLCRATVIVKRILVRHLMGFSILALFDIAQDDNQLDFYPCQQSTWLCSPACHDRTNDL